MIEIVSKIHWLYYNARKFYGIGTVTLENGETLYVKSLGLHPYLITNEEFLKNINKIEKALAKEIK